MKKCVHIQLQWFMSVLDKVDTDIRSINQLPFEREWNLTIQNS